jgi:transcriptional regulator with XRE-family HTH domain
LNQNSGQGVRLRRLLSSNIKQFRLNSGLTQENLAEKAGISVPFLGALERGDKWPSPDTLAGIAYGLEVEPYDLLKPEDAVTRDVKKVIAKLASDIEKTANHSVNMLNSIVSNGDNQ